MNSYVISYVLRRSKVKASLTVLDFGCGRGEIVRELRRHGIAAYGCDIFYEGRDYSNEVPPEMWGDTIRRMHSNEIPFPSGFFDLVVNSEVFEHVPNLDPVLAEIARVLKPDGALLSLFPSYEVWREGHFGLLFLHWFSNGSAFRLWYAAFCRMLGFGYQPEDKTVLQWSRKSCEWLDRWTFYRTRKELDSVFRRHFTAVMRLEDDWFDHRLARYGRRLSWIPRTLKRFLVRKLHGVVFFAGKSPHGAPFSIPQEVD